MTTCNCKRHNIHADCFPFCDCAPSHVHSRDCADDPSCTSDAAPSLLPTLGRNTSVQPSGAPDVNTLDGLIYSLTNQAPIDPKVIILFEQVRAAAFNYAEHMLRICPDGRAKSIAITHLEESVMWAIKSIAIDQGAAMDRNPNTQ